jgi:hypothetical protein
MSLFSIAIYQFKDYIGKKCLLLLIVAMNRIIEVYATDKKTVSCSMVYLPKRLKSHQELKLH